MPRITLRDHKLHYQQSGEGPDILLLHGLACNIACWWFHVVPDLAKTMRVLAVDLRGHGFSEMTETGYRAVDLAADMASLLDHLDISGVHVVGHSFGGAVAAALATERPDLVSALTLADAWLPSLQPVPGFPAAGDWAATIARARARGLVVDPNLPLVVRDLYSEMLDEHEFVSDSALGREMPRAEVEWETPPGSSPMPRSRLAVGRKPAGPGRGGWAMRGGWRRLMPPVFRRLERAGPAQSAARGQTPPEAAAPAPFSTFQEALAMTGEAGKPSLSVRRWRELMRRTRARTEYLDPTAIEAAALKDIRAPVHLVYGSRSRYRPTAERLQELLGRARLTIVPRAGHHFPLLRPTALVEAILQPEHDGAEAGQGQGKPRLRVVAGNETPESDEAGDAAPQAMNPGRKRS